jgi:hypothetical protein
LFTDLNDLLIKRKNGVKLARKNLSLHRGKNGESQSIDQKDLRQM